MTRSSLVVTCHDKRGSCVVVTADGPASFPTVVKVCSAFYVITTVYKTYLTFCNDREPCAFRFNIHDDTFNEY